MIWHAGATKVSSAHAEYRDDDQAVARAAAMITLVTASACKIKDKCDPLTLTIRACACCAIISHPDSDI
jgi:hypothetical protein